MKSICLVIPFFGKFHNYFNLWLESVRYNRNVNFLIITDSEEEYDFPNNVKIVKTSLDILKDKIQGLYSFKIKIDTPYKLCDFRPAYGDIFRDELADFDFWGYCDVDLIFGNIRKFVTDEILEQYEKINLHGHFSLYRNNDKMNFLYKKGYKELIDYKYVFKQNWSYHFDEYPGISLYCKRDNVMTIDIEQYADMSWLDYKFIKKYDKSERSDDSKDIEQIFYWKDGKLLNLIKDNNQIEIEEFMYIHLQKRKMVNKVEDFKKGYFIVPNEFIQLDYEEAINKISEYCVDKECEYVEIFRKECRVNRFKIGYWKQKIKMLGKKCE